MKVYLDNSATTRCFDEVAQLMMQVMCRDYGNPSSLHHKGVAFDHDTDRTSGSDTDNAVSGESGISCDLSAGGWTGQDPPGRPAESNL